MRFVRVGKVKTKNEQPERREQIIFSTWLTKKGIRHTASANGGKRSMGEAINLKRMGLSPGFPDVEIPLPVGPYHGMYVEMKATDKGVLSDNQKDWLNYLNSVGYYAICAHGAEEAIAKTLWYLAQK